MINLQDDVGGDTGDCLSRIAGGSDSPLDDVDG